jgi:catechol 2,3-dioxygenase-like lactoylglutathione lyase family enzyme
VAPVEAAQRKDIAGDGTDACDRSEHRVWLVVDGFLMEVDDAAGIRKIVRHERDGAEPATEDARGRLAYSHNGGRFIVTKPIDGSMATHANGGTIGFHMKDAAQAEAWHKAGVANGGTSIEDPPGVRANGAYLAYLRDPDGNKLVAVARPAA